MLEIEFNEGDNREKAKGRQRNIERTSFFLFLLSLCCVSFIGCAQQMGSQPRYRPLEQSTFFRDGQSARPVVPGTVPSGYARGNQRLEAATVIDVNAEGLPFPLTREVLERGRERYGIYCAECHGATGYGDGMIVRRGFSRPPSYHEERLRQAPAGHFFDVMTNGYGAMASYVAQVSERDRWGIAAYIRALQLSQHATVEDVPVEKRSPLESGGEPR